MAKKLHELNENVTPTIRRTFSEVRQGDIIKVGMTTFHTVKEVRHFETYCHVYTNEEPTHARRYDGLVTCVRK